MTDPPGRMSSMARYGATRRIPAMTLGIRVLMMLSFVIRCAVLDE